MAHCVPNLEDLRLADRLCGFLSQSPSSFHAIEAIRARLDAHDFACLDEGEIWDVKPGKRYYTTRGGSSILAFKVGERLEHPRFSVCVSHSDSPTYKIKAVPELAGPSSYVRLNVEGYGGAIDRTWLDRPLSVAGRVMVEEFGNVSSRLFAPDEDLLVVPSVAIHQNREVNKGGSINRQVDMCPLYSAAGGEADGFVQMIADRFGVLPAQVLAYDLVLANRQKPTVWGVAHEFVSAGRLDDLQCAFASLEAFVESSNTSRISVYGCFDNEEIGSGTRQGALSTFLADVLERICECLGMTRSDYLRGVQNSFVVSCDNAHAVHPNHSELYDETNRAWLNQGVVIKESAPMRYTTDAQSRALFELVCRRAGVPVQPFANRSDSAGGSTLGNLLVRNVSMRSVDIGLPQLAMHSSYETAGVRDTAFLVRALSEFYEADYAFCEDGSIVLG